MNKDNNFFNSFIKEESEEISIEELRNFIYLSLIKKERTRAVEAIVQYLLFRNKFYTTRNDKLPEVWIYNEGIYIPNGETYIKEFVREVLENIYTVHFCNEVIDRIKADTFIDQDLFFNSPIKDEIAVLNGILNLRTKKLSSFTHKKIFFNKINAIYDIDKDCPNIKKFFFEVLKNPSDIKVIQELFGFVLYKEYFIEKSFMFSGEGRNGKGKTLKLIRAFLGIDNCVSLSLEDISKDSFTISLLHNKLVNLAGDLDNTSLKKTGSFKGLTARDMFSSDRKFKSRINFENFAKMIFCANTLPIVYDLSPAFWNRWILLEFPFKFLPKSVVDCAEDKTNLKVEDVNIINKLTTPEELSGLLNWAIEGLERLLINSKFSYSKSVEDVTLLWMRKSNSFTAFMMDNLIEDFDCKISKEELRKIYSLYCRTHKIKPISEIVLKNTFLNIGVSETRSTRDSVAGVYCWVGVKFKFGYVLNNWSSYNGELIKDCKIESENINVVEEVV